MIITKIFANKMNCLPKKTIEYGRELCYNKNNVIKGGFFL